MPRPKTALAKLTKPNAAGLLHRERLFDRLEAQPAGRLLWIAAPAGSGKTSLASSWIESRGLSHVWYQLDQGDSDPATLIDYLGRVARQGNSRKRTVLPRLTPERLPGLHVFVQRFFEGFFELLGGPRLLVFDNFHELALDSPSIEIIAGCVRALPDGTRVICISRERPPAAFARWQADPLLCEIDYAALRLTNDEAHTLAGTDTAAAAAELNRLTCGWAAGVRLLSRAKNWDTQAGCSEALTPGHPLFEYFLREVFEQQTPELRRFLLRSAVLPRLIPGVTAALTADAQTNERLLWLQGFSLVTALGSPADPHVVYEYHALFREFLLKYAGESLGAEELRRLAGQGAQLLTELGHVDDAFGLWAESRDWGKLSELLLEQAPAFAAAGRYATLARWLDVIPESLRRESGWLSYWEGVGATVRNPLVGREYLARAAERFEALHDVHGHVQAIATIITGYAMEYGHFTTMDPWIRHLERNLPELSSLPLAVQVRVVSCGRALLMRAPEHVLVERLAIHANNLIRSGIELEHRVRIAEFLISYLQGRGDYAAAESICRDMSALCRKDQRLWSQLQFYECAVQRYAANYEAAFAIADKLLLAARAEGLLYLEAAAHAEAACAAASAEDAERLERSIHAGRLAQGYQRSAMEALFDSLQAALFSMTRQPEAAIACAERSLERARQAGNSQLEPIACSVYGQVLMLVGRHEIARKYLLESIARGLPMPSSVSGFGPLLCLAWSHFQTGDAAAATTFLRKAFELGARQNYMSYPYWNSTVMSDLCARALDAAIEPDYVCRLIRKHQLRPPTEVEGWPYSVRLQTLGEFALLIDDVPVRFGAKTPKKPLELLKAMVANGGRAVSLEQLSEQIWPDLEADAARNSLEIALHRLRKLLKYPQAVIVTDGKLSLDSSWIWIDVWAFQTVVQSVGLSAMSPDIEALSQQLLRLYRGHFLGDEESAWAISMRERLRSQWIRAIAQLGGLLEAQQQWRQGIDLYRRAIELDPLIEESHRLLMRCYHAQGRIAESIETYRHCRELLLASFGVPPSPATEAVNAD